MERRELAAPWSSRLQTLIAAFSTNRDFEPYDLVTELTAGSWFALDGERTLGPDLIRQTLDEYLESIHSRNGFSRDRMAADAARSFDAAVADAVSTHTSDGIVTLRIETQVWWGRPLAGR